MNINVTKGVSYNNVIPPEDSVHQCVSYTGELPPGMSLSFSLWNAVLSGTPTTEGGGVYSFLIHEATTDTSKAEGTIPVTVTVNDPSKLQPPVISCLGAASNSNGGTYSAPAGAINLSFTVTNQDAYGSWGYSLPSGINPGTNNGPSAPFPVGGTLTAGIYNLVVTYYNHAFSNGTVQSAAYNLTLTVTPALPVITLSSNATTSGYVGKSISAQCSVQTNAGTVTWSAINLPPGLSINSASGLITGTPATAGLYATKVTATNATGSGTMEVDFVITAATGAPVISCVGATATENGGTLTTTAGTINLQFLATNGGASWSGSFPTGLSINANYGAVSGSLAVGSYTILATCTNTTYSGGTTQNAQYLLSLTVSPAVPVISLADSSSLNVTAGTAVSAQFSIQSTAGTVTWSATSLPVGCTINPTTGRVSGTPTVSGTFNTVITATNSAGSSTFNASFVVASTSTSVSAPYQFLLDDPTLTSVLVETQTGAVTFGRSRPYKAGDKALLAVVFLQAGVTIAPPEKVGISVLANNQFGTDPILTPDAPQFKAAANDQPAYLLIGINLDSDALMAELQSLIDAGGSAVTLTVMSDLRWKNSDGVQITTDTFTFAVQPAVTAQQP